MKWINEQQAILNEVLEFNQVGTWLLQSCLINNNYNSR